MTQTQAELNADVFVIANETADAYSHDRYGRRQWLLVAKYLKVDCGYTVAQSIDIMESKYTRWAADQYGDPVATAEDFMMWAEENSAKFFTPKAVANLGER